MCFGVQTFYLLVVIPKQKVRLFWLVRFKLKRRENELRLGSCYGQGNSLEVNVSPKNDREMNVWACVCVPQ